MRVQQSYRLFRVPGANPFRRVNLMAVKREARLMGHSKNGRAGLLRAAVVGLAVVGCSLVQARAQGGTATFSPTASEASAAAAKLLAQTGFYRPVAVDVRLDVKDYHGGRVPNTQDADIAALLRARGILGVQWKPQAAPWWEFTLGLKPLARATNLHIGGGTRRITAISDERLWETNATFGYAETVSYKVVADPDERFPMPPISGSFRIVIFNAPAVGAWRVRSSGFNPGRDSFLLKEKLAAEGVKYKAKLSSNIQFAINFSMDRIQADLARRGILALSSKDSRVLISPNAHTMFLKGRTVPIGEATTQDQLAAYCAGQRALGARWRLPSYRQMQTILTHTTVGAMLTDTPDHRLWGRFEYFKNQRTLIPMSAQSKGTGTDLMSLSSFWAYIPNLASYYPGGFYPLNPAQIRVRGRDAGSSPIDSYQDEFREAKMICAAPFYGNVRDSILSTTERPAESTQPATGAVAASATDVPQFTKDTPYTKVRAGLLKAGWKPAKLRTTAFCGVDASQCPPFPEVLDCAGAGDAACQYSWQKAGKYLVVYGTGENYRDQPLEKVKLCHPLAYNHLFGWQCK